MADQRLVNLEKGINPIADVGTGDQRRKPAICLRTTPWKAGTRETPWHDVFDLEGGRAIYFGDHKLNTTKPLGLTSGNKSLRDAWELHRSNDRHDRLVAPPLLAFRAVDRTSPAGTIERKGAVQFLGLAVLTNATEIDATDPLSGRQYENMMFELALLTLPNGGTFDWSWINARRTPTLDTEAALKRAPSSWRVWVNTSVIT
jgi:hypothetical protein